MPSKNPLSAAQQSFLEKWRAPAAYALPREPGISASECHAKRTSSPNGSTGRMGGVGEGSSTCAATDLGDTISRAFCFWFCFLVNMLALRGRQWLSEGLLGSAFLLLFHCL